MGNEYQNILIFIALIIAGDECWATNLQQFPPYLSSATKMGVGAHCRSGEQAYIFNVFNIAVHASCNLFWEKCSLFGKILVTCLKCSKVFLRLPLMAKRCAGVEVPFSHSYLWAASNRSIMNMVNSCFLQNRGKKAG